MRPDIEKQFEDLAEEIGRKASAVKCSLGDYAEGLGIIIASLESIQQAAEGEAQDEADGLR